MVKHTEITYGLLEKAFEKQTKKQVGASKSLELSNKSDGLKQIDATF